MRFSAKFIEIISWFFVALLGLRFVLKLFGASIVAPFVLWLYTITDNLMKPFAGIFPSPSLGGASIIDIPTIVAIVVYFAAGYFLSVLIISADNNLKIKGLKPQPSDKNKSTETPFTPNNPAPQQPHQQNYSQPTNQQQYVPQPQPQQYMPPQPQIPQQPMPQHSPQAMPHPDDLLPKPNPEPTTNTINNNYDDNELN
ncbi:MAG: YggT family protein [Patescibacteria group bacterium]